MQALTLTIASIASLIVFLVSPIYGLVVYIASFAWYPTYLSVPVGTIDFTLRRIVILALFAKLFLLTDLPKQFRFKSLDKCVVVYFMAQLLAGVINSSPFEPFLENRCGEILDTVFPYFAVRMIIRNRQQYLALLKWILIIAVPLAVLGFYESLTGQNMLGYLREYNAWATLTGAPLGNTPWERCGFFRANVVFSHPIMYGLYFAMFGPICVGLMQSIKGYKNLCVIGLVLMGIGVFSSMSGGPWLAVFVAVPFIAFYRWRNYWKPVVVSIIVMCAVVEIISNRHFYDVLSDFSFSTANAWYRSRLIDVALFEGGLSGHWLFGYPFGADTGWGPKIVGLSYTDMVNHYLSVLVAYGLLGFIPFLALNVLVLKNLLDAFKISSLDSDKWLIWCLAGSFWGIGIAFMTVSIYGPPITIYYVMIGFASLMPSIVMKRSSLQKIAVPNRNRLSFVPTAPKMANSGRIQT